MIRWMDDDDDDEKKSSCSDFEKNVNGISIVAVDREQYYYQNIHF